MRRIAWVVVPVLCSIGGGLPAARAGVLGVTTVVPQAFAQASVSRFNPGFSVDMDQREVPESRNQFDVEQDLSASRDVPAPPGSGPVYTRIRVTQASLVDADAESISVESTGSLEAERVPSPDGGASLETQYAGAIGFEVAFDVETGGHFAIQASLHLVAEDSDLRGSMTLFGLPDGAVVRSVGGADGSAAAVNVVADVDRLSRFEFKVRLSGGRGGAANEGAAAGGTCTWKVRIAASADPPSDTFSWKQKKTGAFATSVNWSPPDVPVDDDAARNDTAVFALKGKYTVDLESGKRPGRSPRAGAERRLHRIIVETGSPTYAGPTFVATSPSEAEPSFLCRNGAVALFSNGTVRSQFALVDDGRVRLLGAGSRWDNEKTMRLGGDGPAELELGTGTVVKSARTVLGDATVSVTGVGAKWEPGDVVTGLLQSSLPSVVAVATGAGVESGTVALGAPGDGSVVVLVSGVSLGVPSRWKGADLQVGRTGAATFSVLDGATAELTGALTSGSRAGGLGAVSVVRSAATPTTDGPQSRLTAVQLAVGHDLGKGSLEVRDGALVSVSGDCSAGSFGGDGTVLVTGFSPQGVRAALEVAGELSLGAGPTYGIGRLRIENQGRVACANATVGTIGEGTGDVEIEGIESTWEVDGDLRVEVGEVELFGGILDVAGGIEQKPSGALAGNGVIIVADQIVVDGPIAAGNVTGAGAAGTSGKTSRAARAKDRNSPGLLMIQGDLVLGPNAVVTAEVAGPGSAQADALVVTGNATLGGTLVVQFMNGYAPRAGDRFEVLDVLGTVSGDHDSVRVEGLVDGTAVSLEKTAAGYVATASADAEALPAVSVRASPKKLLEKKTRKRGVLTFQRKGDRSEALTVRYEVGGTLRNGVDCARLSGTVVIPAGKKSAKVPVELLADAFAEGTETLVVTVLPGARHTHSAASVARIAVADDD